MKLTDRQKDIIRKSFDFEYKNIISDFEQNLEDMADHLFSLIQDSRDKIKAEMVDSYNRTMDDLHPSYEDSSLFPELFAELEEEDE